jgi:hypothetical protein
VSDARLQRLAGRDVELVYSRFLVVVKKVTKQSSVIVDNHK